jgi:hypothetical protein
MDQVALAESHNEAVKLYREGQRDAAAERLAALLDRDFVVSGRALFQILWGQGRDAEAVRIAARTALVDPMHFEFVQTALGFAVAHASSTPTEYEPIATQPRGWSVIVCSHRDAQFAKFETALQRIRGAHELQVIRIADAQSMGAGYERGLREAKFENVILCHHDIELRLPDSLDWLALALDRFNGVGFAGATRMSGPAMLYDGHPYLSGRLLQTSARSEQVFALSPFSGAREAAVLDGSFMAFRRSALETLGFDTSLPGFHYYDIDLCYRARQMGFALGIVPQIALFHESHGDFDESWARAKKYFEDKHRFHGDSREPARHFYGAAIDREAVGSVWRVLNELAVQYDRSAIALNISQSRERTAEQKP